MIAMLILLAEDPQPQPSLLSSFWIFIPILIVFYFLMIRPMRRQEQERQALLSIIKKNDKVLTIGGIYGTVISVAEKEDEIVVEVDKNVRMKMTKNSIARNLTNEELAKAAKEPPAADKQTSTAIQEKGK